MADLALSASRDTQRCCVPRRLALPFTHLPKILRGACRTSSAVSRPALMATSWTWRHGLIECILISPFPIIMLAPLFLFAGHSPPKCPVCLSRARGEKVLHSLATQACTVRSLWSGLRLILASSTCVFRQGPPF